MKTIRIILILFVFLLVIWMAAIVNASILTTIYKGEFWDTERVGFTGMHPWDGQPNLRVLYYTNKEAHVYYYGKMGGEKAVFIKANGKWNYEKTTHTWSNYGGTADDYLVWPYFKNWVF